MEENANKLLEEIYKSLYDSSVGPYLYDASLTRLSQITKQSEIEIRRWFRRTRWEQRNSKGPVPGKVDSGTEPDNFVTIVINQEIDKVIKSGTEVDQNYNKLALEHIYKQLSDTPNGPYLYDADLELLGQRIGLSNHQIHDWFSAKRNIEKKQGVPVPEEVPGATSGSFVSKIIEEAIALMDRKKSVSQQPCDASTSTTQVMPSEKEAHQVDPIKEIKEEIEAPEESSESNPPAKSTENVATPKDVPLPETSSGPVNATEPIIEDVAAHSAPESSNEAIPTPAPPLPPKLFCTLIRRYVQLDRTPPCLMEKSTNVLCESCQIIFDRRQQLYHELEQILMRPSGKKRTHQDGVAGPSSKVMPSE
ncbi:hypothetical protein GCK72_015190 [Caenorhabditis remanei]|uniref:Homeobox domain-containing protein n=1 Tax=Caenorhabditis remanei TaxID=31234 RepID=A0A6A5GTF4_CAERE|nr:hypothetical protein GCK72_015190 [Caenorhabditis remanei]KAF1758730.1 hypothetical protein GCK72_015190 [Caenorhabditis remanei]